MKKRKPRPSNVLVKLVDRTINGPDPERAKAELLARIGHLERAASRTGVCENALINICGQLKGLKEGKCLAYSSDPFTIAGISWIVNNSVRLREQEESKAELERAKTERAPTETV